MRQTSKLNTEREYWIKKNSYYYDDLVKFYKYNIPNKSSVLEVGSGIGEILHKLNVKKGVGIDLSSNNVRLSKSKYKKLKFLQMDPEKLKLKESFDFIICSDSVSYFSDVEKVFSNLSKISNDDTRLIINYHSYLWLPILNLAEKLGYKMPSIRLNWLNYDDLDNLLYLSGFEVIKKGNRFLFPRNLGLISVLANKYLANLPLINLLCLTNFIIARKIPENNLKRKLSVSVIIPARNEKGNIENAIKRLPKMGKKTEVIFIEGHSSDETLTEIKRIAKKYSADFPIKYAIQKGKGKGDAVRLGFDMASGDILMILDADLTVPPEDLPKFYDAIASGRGEFINGSRLVYPMENEAMRTLNIFGNKFFSIMFTWLLGQRLKDTLCGTKVISRNNYQRLIKNRSYFGEFDPFGDFDLLFGAAKLNLKIVELPIRYRAREYGTTNISRFKHGWLLLKMVVFAMNKIKFI